MRPAKFALLAAMAALPLLAVAPAVAQQQGIASDAMLPPLPADTETTLRATLTAINPQTRAVTLRGANGNTVTITAGPAVRLEGLKVGDVVDARFIRATAMMVSTPGEKLSRLPRDAVGVAAARPEKGPGGVAIMATRVTAVVVGINVEQRQVSVVDPSGGGVFAVHVTDPERVKLLPKLKVGDAVTAVITESLAVSITPAS
jgi:hypothetical protein